MKYNTYNSVRTIAAVTAGALGGIGLTGCSVTADQDPQAPGLYGANIGSVTDEDLDMTHVDPNGNHKGFIRGDTAKLDFYQGGGSDSEEKCGVIKFAETSGSSTVATVSGSYDKWPNSDNGVSCNYSGPAILSNPEGALEQVDKLVTKDMSVVGVSN